MIYPQPKENAPTQGDRIGPSWLAKSFSYDFFKYGAELVSPIARSALEMFDNGNGNGQEYEDVGVEELIDLYKGEGDVERDITSKEGKPTFPTQEEIEESSLTKVTQHINQACEQLKKEKIFHDAFAFANKKIGQKKNKRAILHTLCRCYLAKPKEPYPYCVKILKVEDGNFNEREHSKTS